MSKRVFNEKEIEHARDMDMLSYLESKGETFTQTGNYYKHNEHDSLVICPSKGYYVWNSHGGRERADRSCIDLAMAFFNLNFSEAVTDILEHSNVKKIDRSRESVHRDFSYERE
ncbi:MAG: hypothetical protein K0R31_1423, partial [Clostridiales bacterium]|nr:hypothetical protein [Clostridiales bacterium]